MNDAACVAGFLDDTTSLRHAGVPIVIVTHFAETHRRVAESLQGLNIASTLISSPHELSPSSLAAPGDPRGVPMVPFPVLQLAAPFPAPEKRSDEPCLVVVPEPYPTSARNELVTAFAASLPFQAAVRFYVSLESPIMRRFGGEDIVGLLTRLGMAENDVIENPMLARAFESSQKKLARLVKEDQWAASVHAWFAMNEKHLGNRR